MLIIKTLEQLNARAPGLEACLRKNLHEMHVLQRLMDEWHQSNGVWENGDMDTPYFDKCFLLERLNDELCRLYKIDSDLYLNEFYLREFNEKSFYNSASAHLSAS